MKIKTTVRKERELNPTIRELRKIIAMTQKEFAASLGVSVDAVKSWETRGQKPSTEILQQIAITLGAKFEGNQVHTLSGKRYTQEYFQRWAARAESNSDFVLNAQVKDSCETLHRLFRAAMKAQHLAAVSARFNRWVIETAQDFDLSSRINRR